MSSDARDEARLVVQQAVRHSFGLGFVGFKDPDMGSVEIETMEELSLIHI